MEIASELLQFAMLPSAPAVKFSDDLVNNYVTTAVDSLPADIVNNILGDSVISVGDSETVVDPVTQRDYITYHVRVYSPYASWTVRRRYRDFLLFHQALQHIDCNHSQFVSLACFEFPQKSVFYSIEYTVNERKQAFEKYLLRAQKIPELNYMLAQFLEVHNHIEEYEENCDISFENSCWKNVDSGSEEMDRSSHGILSRSNSGIHGKKMSHLKPYRMLREIELRSVSEILDDDMATNLYSFLPPFVQSEKFQLAYATHKHGWSMLTLYEKIGTHSPLILLIDPVDGNDVVGVFMNTPLGPPSFSMKGDGDCFVFVLGGQGGSDSACYRCPTAVGEESIEASGTLSEYAFANMEYLAFGGSIKESCNAIRLSNDLMYCSCGPSDTYSNPRLLDLAISDPFAVRNVEVFISGGISV